MPIIGGGGGGSVAFTNGTVVGVFHGGSIALAFTNPSQLDLIQIINQGGKVVWNLNYLGVAATNPTAPTTGPTGIYSAMLRQFFAPSLAAAFTNPGNLDILQIMQRDYNPIFHVDYLGVAHTP